MKRITVDVDKCAGCRYCELACSGHQHQQFSPSLSRITVIKDDHMGLDYPVLCHQCEECPPKESCPTGALMRAGGCLVVSEGCIGCGLCVDECGFGAIKLAHGHPIVCDLCGGSPECVKRCPTGALRYDEYSSGFDNVADELAKLQRRMRITV